LYKERVSGKIFEQNRSSNGSGNGFSNGSIEQLETDFINIKRLVKVESRTILFNRLLTPIRE
jgi:hypothetical protein